MQTFTFLVGGSLSDETAACLAALEARYPGLSVESLMAGSGESAAQGFAAFACLTDEEGERLMAGPGGAMAGGLMDDDLPLTPSLARCIIDAAGEDAFAGLTLDGEMPLPLMQAFVQCAGGAMAPDTEERDAFIDGLASLYGVDEEPAACIADNLGALGVELGQGMLDNIGLSAAVPGPVAEIVEQCGVSPDALQPGG